MCAACPCLTCHVAWRYGRSEWAHDILSYIICCASRDVVFLRTMCGGVQLHVEYNIIYICTPPYSIVLHLSGGARVGARCCAVSALRRHVGTPQAAAGRVLRLHGVAQPTNIPLLLCKFYCMILLPICKSTLTQRYVIYGLTWLCYKRKYNKNLVTKKKDHNLGEQPCQLVAGKLQIMPSS